MTVKVEDVNKAAAVIVEFCDQHKECFDCEAWKRGPLYGHCIFKAFPNEWGFLAKREGGTMSEKEKPQLVRLEYDGYADGRPVYDTAYCQNCGNEFELDTITWGCKYCPECGQRLDWEGAES